MGEINRSKLRSISTIIAYELQDVNR